VSKGSFLRVKQHGREDNHSPPFTAEFKIAWRYTSTPNKSSWRGV